MVAEAPSSEQVFDDARSWFNAEHADDFSDHLKIDDLGTYYDYTLELDGDRFRVSIGDFTDEPDEPDPKFRFVIQRLGVNEKNHKFWRVMVDVDGNHLVQKGGMSSDKAYLELAAEVLEDGKIVGN